MSGERGASAASMGRSVLRGVARVAAGMAPPTIAREEATVVANNGDGTLDLNRGSEEHPQMMRGVRCLTTCSSAMEGDVVLVDTCDHISYAVGVLARP